MIEQIFEEKAVIWVVAGICLLSILIKVIVALCYKHLIKEADDMICTTNKFLIKVRTGFETEFEKSYPVNNISVYVDKYMYGMRILGLRPSSWEGFGTFSLIVCLMLGSISSLWSYENGFRDDVILYIFSGAVTAGLIVLVDSLINIQRSREYLHVNMCNFLENHMKPRLERGDYDYEINNLSKLSDEIDEGMMELINSMTPVIKENKSKSETEIKEEKLKKRKNDKIENNNMINLSKGEQKIVEDIIKEYLT